MEDFDILTELIVGQASFPFALGTWEGKERAVCILYPYAAPPLDRDFIESWDEDPLEIDHTPLFQL